MRIALDAMGGDFAPQVTVEGALKASQEYQIEVLLVGVEKLIKKEFAKLGRFKGKVDIIDAAEAIGMGEGILSFRKKQRSSIRVAVQLIKDGEAEAFVSMGNTAAVVYISKKILGSLKGIEKPGLSLLVPSLKNPTLLIDVGASVNCQPHHLVQFAVMGQIFMESVLGLKNPRIGLMSIGEEDTKGNELTRETYELLESSPLNFIGNVEGKDLYSGKADIIVSDGFTGNVALKASEGVIDTLYKMARTEVMKDLLSKIGFFLMKRNLKRLYKKINYAEYGGAPLLGINGVCIIGHGRSNSTAVKNAIRLASEFVKNRVQEKIEKELGKFSFYFAEAKA